MTRISRTGISNSPLSGTGPRAHGAVTAWADGTRRVSKGAFAITDLPHTPQRRYPAGPRSLEPAATHASRHAGAGRDRTLFLQSGFTLIELLAVIIILGGVLAVVLPRFTGVGSTHLRTDAKKAATLVRYLSDASATRHVFYRMRFDLDGDSIDVAVSDDGETFVPETTPGLKGLAFRGGVELADITVPGLGRVDSGSVDFFFSPAGAAGPFILNMKRGELTMTVRFNPYSNRAVIDDGSR